MNYQKEIDAILPKLPHRTQVRFAVFCAKRCFENVEAKHRDACRNAIDLAKRFSNGEDIPRQDLLDAHAYSAASDSEKTRIEAFKAMYEELLRIVDTLSDLEKFFITD